MVRDVVKSIGNEEYEERDEKCVVTEDGERNEKEVFKIVGVSMHHT